MSIATNIKRLLPKGSTPMTEKETTPKFNGLGFVESLGGEGRIIDDARVLSQQIERANQRLAEINAARAALAEKKQKRLLMAKSAYLNGETIDTRSMDDAIDAAEHELPAMEREAQVLNSVIATLEERARGNQQVIELMRVSGMRERIRALDDALQAFLPAYQQAADTLKQIAVEVAAVAAAREQITLVSKGSRERVFAQAHVEVGILHAKSYDASSSLDKEAMARSREILSELGVRV